MRLDRGGLACGEATYSDAVPLTSQVKDQIMPGELYSIEEHGSNNFPPLNITKRLTRMLTL